MKKFLPLIALVFTSLFSKSQGVITVSGDISANTTWTSNNVYILIGFVYVTNNAELTIQPGTIIKGDKPSKGSLIITRGSKITAIGTPSQPIVFTSNEPEGQRSYGDWGGIILCGKAPVNDPAGEKLIEGGVDAVKGLYGGTDANDNSGSLIYVRIEFPGIAFMPNNEINGLTLGGVGRGTTIDYVQISYSGDDSFECFGGTVNLKHLVAFRGLDDDFDTDFGFQGKCQFLIALRDSNVADVSGSNGFESDNDATGSTNVPITYPVYSNVTIVGPLQTASTSINSNFKRGAHIRRSAKTSIFNSALIGFPVGLLVDGANCEANANANELNFKNNVIAGCTTPLAVASGSAWDISTWFNQSGANNTILSNSSDVMLMNATNYNTPDFMPMMGSPLLNDADFSNNLLADSFFTAVNYRGAIGNDNWTSDWTNFDPENTIYTSLEEVSNLNSLGIYPNPSNGIFNLNIDAKNPSKVNIEIISLSGQRAFEITGQSLQSGNNTITINAGNLSSGIYNVRVISDKSIYISRISIL